MTLITLLASILVFGFVIFFHELGHFVTAKKSGIQVNEFSIGMGPALFKTIRRGTQYSIRLLPIGGYVSMEGEDGEEEDKGEAERPPTPSPRGKRPAGPLARWPSGSG